MSQYILSIDQGTTSSRAMLFDQNGQAAFTAQQEFTQHFPKDGWVEHDAEEIWGSQLRAARGALEKAGASAADVVAIGITAVVSMSSAAVGSSSSNRFGFW